MSNLQAAFKVGNQLISRLFDHRPFTDGEIKFIHKEVIEKNDLDAKFNSTISISQDICVIADSIDESKFLDDNVARSLTLRPEQVLTIEQGAEFKRGVSQEVSKSLALDLAQRKINADLELKEALRGFQEEERELERKLLKFENHLKGQFRL